MGLRVRAHQGAGLNGETLWSYDPSANVEPDETATEPTESVTEPTLTPEPPVVVAQAPEPTEPVVTASVKRDAKPPVGYYRNLLDMRDANLRFALAGQPLPSNARVQCGAVVTRVIQHIESQASDPYAGYYANALRDRSIIVITLSEKSYAPPGIY